MYEIGPISVSEDREQDFMYKVEVLRNVGDVEEYRLFLWSKHRYFIRRRRENSNTASGNRQADNPYKVEVRRDLEGVQEYRLFTWNKSEFIKQLMEKPDDWQKKLVEAKDNSVLWEEMKGSTVEDVLNLLTEELVRGFSSLGDDMRNLRYRELVKTVDLEPISIEETNGYYHFRIEIMRDEWSEKSYQAQVYRRECYGLQPTFAVDGELAYDLANCWLWIEDEQNLLGRIDGSTVEQVVEQAVLARNDLENRLRSNGI